MVREVHEVVAVVAPATQRPLFERLLQLYLHDFSEHTLPGSPHGEVNQHGLFAYPPGIGAYWDEHDRVPLLILADGHIAGFALLNRWSALSRAVDHAVAEFFVLRKYRRARVGFRAAHHVFRLYPGGWEIPVASYNPGALLFWRAAVRATGADHVLEIGGDGVRWSGTVLCFNSAVNEPTSRPAVP